MIWGNDLFLFIASALTCMWDVCAVWWPMYQPWPVCEMCAMCRPMYQPWHVSEMCVSCADWCTSPDLYVRCVCHVRPMYLPWPVCEMCESCTSPDLYVRCVPTDVPALTCEMCANRCTRPDYVRCVIRVTTDVPARTWMWDVWAVCQPMYQTWPCEMCDPCDDRCTSPDLNVSCMIRVTTDVPALTCLWDVSAVCQPITSPDLYVRCVCWPMYQPWPVCEMCVPTDEVSRFQTQYEVNLIQMRRYPQLSLILKTLTWTMYL